MQENVYLTLTTSILGDGMASSLEEATQKQLLLKGFLGWKVRNLQKNNHK